MAKHNRAREAARRRVDEQRAAGSSQPFGFASPREVKMPKWRFSRGKTIMVLVVILALVVVGYCSLPLIFPEDEVETEEEELLLNISEDDITAISWTYDGQTTEVELEDDTWVISEDPDAELDQSSVSSIASYLASATVARSISTDSVAEEMGLDDPVVEAQITLSDGSTATLTIGSYDDSGSYTYVSTASDGSEQIALVSYTLLSALSTDISQLYEMEDAPAASQVDSLTIEYDGQTFLLAYIEGGSEELSYTSDYEWFAGTDESDLVAVSENSASLVTTVVNNVSWESCVDPDYDGSVDYGFDDPTLTAVLEYTDQESVDTGETDDDGNAVYETQDVQGTFTLIVGDMASGDTYYAQSEGSSAVYTMSADDVETLLDASVESLAADDICLMDWDTVDSIEITYGDETKTIEFVREESEESDDADSDDESDEDDEDSDDTETTYTIDGEEVDSSSVEDLLTAIEDLAAESEADGDAVGEGFEISFTFYRNTATFAEMTLGFIQYNNSFYLVSFNGEERLLVNRNDIAELEELFDVL